MLDLESALLFMDVAESGSITKTAARRYLSKSMVKKRIDALESFVGTKLLERSPQGVQLTPAGKTFVAYAQRIFALVDEMREECKGATELASQRVIRVAFYTDYVFPVVQYCCDSYTAKNPNDAIVPVFTKFSNARNGLRNDLFDVAMCPRGDISESAGLTIVPLYMNYMTGLVGWGSKLAQQNSLTREMLSKHTVVTNPIWCPKSEIEAWAHAQTPWIDVQFSTGGSSAIQSACMQDGVYLYPESDAGLLPFVPVPLEEPLQSLATLTYPVDPVDGVLDFVQHAVEFFGALTDSTNNHLLTTWSTRPT